MRFNFVLIGSSLLPPWQRGIAHFSPPVASRMRLTLTRHDRDPFCHTSSLPFQPHRVAISPVDDGSSELVYLRNEATEANRHSVLASPPPPPISAQKMHFLARPISPTTARTRNHFFPSLSLTSPSELQPLLFTQLLRQIFFAYFCSTQSGARVGLGGL